MTILMTVEELFVFIFKVRYSDAELSNSWLEFAIPIQI